MDNIKYAENSNFRWTQFNNVFWNILYLFCNWYIYNLPWKKHGIPRYNLYTILIFWNSYSYICFLPCMVIQSPTGSIHHIFGNNIEKHLMFFRVLIFLHKWHNQFELSVFSCWAIRPFIFHSMEYIQHWISL